MRRLLFIIAIVALVLPLRAQDDRDAEWRASFNDGLGLLRARKLDEAVKAFEKCVQLFPDRAVGHYNEACAHALAGRAPRAVECLSRSFDRGFLDLAHVARDHDLDPIRSDASFTKLVDDARAKLIREARWEVASPKADGAPLVVWLHDDGEDPAALRSKLSEQAPELGAWILSPEGRVKVRGGRRWDSTAETVVMHAIAAVSSEKKTEARPVIVGAGDGATVAWKIVRANPGAFRGAVLARGVYGLDDDDAGGSPAGLRFWLTAPASEDDPLARAAFAARARLVDDGAEVVLDRADGEPARDAVARAIGWALGRRVEIGRPPRHF